MYIQKIKGSCPITTEMALIYDAVIAFAEATKYIQYMPQALNCSSLADNVQTDGSTFKNYMRSVSEDFHSQKKSFPVLNGF